MRHRSAPSTATWLLKLFCSSAEQESVIGDLLEQYQLGRGRFWYWRQVLAIVFLGLYGKAVRRPLVTTNRTPVRQGLALMLLIAVLAVVLGSPVWLLFALATLSGAITGILLIGLRNSRTERTISNPAEAAISDAPGLARIQMDRPMTDRPMTTHPGISMQHIPVEGAVGFLFVFATVFIFGVGVPAIRYTLVVTAPLGILVSVVLIYWHKRHPREIQALDLNKKK